MTTLALYVGLADASGRPFAEWETDALRYVVDHALSDLGVDVLASGRLDGADENGAPEQSWHYLVHAGTGVSLLSLFRTLATLVAASDQRSYGVVGWGPGTVVLADPTGSAAESWYRSGFALRGGHSA